MKATRVTSGDSTHGGRLLRFWDCAAETFVTVTARRLQRAKTTGPNFYLELRNSGTEGKDFFPEFMSSKFPTL